MSAPVFSRQKVDKGSWVVCVADGGGGAIFVVAVVVVGDREKTMHSFSRHARRNPPPSWTSR